MRHFNTLRLGAVVALSAFSACGDSTTATQRPLESIRGEPQSTLASGITSTQLVRANAGSLHIQSKYQGFKAELKLQDDADVVVATLVATPGGKSGWHSHPGITMVSIRSGALTTYDASDSQCQGVTYGAGSVFIEEGGHVHYARNETSGNTEWVTTYIVPKGGPVRVDEPNPGNCPF